jgi:hypothetical protein
LSNPNNLKLMPFLFGKIMENISSNFEMCHLTDNGAK